MNLKKINEIYPNVKKQDPELYVKTLEDLLNAKDEHIKSLHETSKEWKKLAQDMLKDMQSRTESLEEAFHDGFEQALQQGSTYENPLGDGYITADGIDRRTGGLTNEKNH